MSDTSPKPPAGVPAGTEPTLQERPLRASQEEQQHESDATLRAPSAEALADSPREMTASTEVDPLIGTTLDKRYTLVERLGAGGMSVVYLARHEGLKKIVAVKLLRQEIASSTASIARFHREAMAAASIGDPHIVAVNDYGVTEKGEAFLVMERLEGRDLRQTLSSKGALSAGRAVSIARQILHALQAAHARGIVHRDLKAENVFLAEREGNDFVKLLDFGISKLLQPLDGADGSTAATGTGVVMGTPQYIAPEQAHGAPDIDHRVDIYSLGVIVYEMLTGSLPFTGSSALEVLMKHVQEEPKPLRQLRPDLAISAELERVVLRALAKDPKKRFQSAEEMLAALPDPLAMPGGFRSSSLPSTPTATRRRWLLWAALSGLALVAGGVLIVVHPLREKQAPAPPQQRANPPSHARRADGGRKGTASQPASAPAAVEPGGEEKEEKVEKKAARSSRPHTPGKKKKKAGGEGVPSELKSNPYRTP